jgi:hypothetical protein
VFGQEIFPIPLPEPGDVDPFTAQTEEDFFFHQLFDREVLATGDGKASLIELLEVAHDA